MSKKRRKGDIIKTKKLRDTGPHTVEVQLAVDTGEGVIGLHKKELLEEGASPAEARAFFIRGQEQESNKYSTWMEQIQTQVDEMIGLKRELLKDDALTEFEEQVEVARGFLAKAEESVNKIIAIYAENQRALEAMADKEFISEDDDNAIRRLMDESYARMVPEKDSFAQNRDAAWEAIK